MRNLLLLLASAALTSLATPALADQIHAEVDTGMNWGQGYGTNPTLDGRLGEDFGLSPLAFTGIEASLDKVLASGYSTNVGMTGRVGVKPTSGDKVYVLAGYTFSSTPANATHFGVGWEHNLARGLYGALEYRHYTPNSGWASYNALTAGFGVHF